MDWIDDPSTDEVRSLEAEHLHELFDPEQFPVTTAEFLEEYGDLEIEYPWGERERVETILRTSGMETYRTQDDLQLALLNGVSRDAVGRPRYSDRGDEPHEAYKRMPRSF
ncbi:hypothetical protein BRC81_01250 [Halobacteriales archaeon QS_1_68_20]|nr:MAG: hypothetical protein BRC81_01250 [Halobacteriales archaeon QS_1_68_20]